MHSAHNIARTPGQELPGALAHTMSMTFGHDFSRVRVHHDAQAAASAAHYASDAYTFGSHIVFGAKQYQPDSESGRRLLMHELTHVVQAHHGGGTATGISSPSDASEQKASRIAAADGWTDGNHVGVGAAPSSAVQRQEHTGGRQAAAPSSDVPTEKWSQTLEAAYRAQGDLRRAAAIRYCRESGGRACDLVLTQSEVRALYDAAQNARGDEQRVRADVSRVVPVMGLLGPLPNIPPPTVPGVPPPSTVIGAGGAIAGGISTGTAVAITGAVAIVAICVIAGIQLWQLGKFQQELESRGFIILDDALAVCIKGCHHTSPVRLPTFREFPELPSTPGLPMSPLSPRDEEALRRWLEELPPPSPTRQTEPEPRPTPRVRPGDPDIDQEERRGCRGMATYQRGGNTCHDQFATSVSGVTREWLVTTPTGMPESFDARGRDERTLYEMKTGYGYLGIQNPTPNQRAMIEDKRMKWTRQAADQQIVADLCGYNLVWYFTNEAARAFADGIIQAPTERVPFRCDTDGERRRRRPG